MSKFGTCRHAWQIQEMYSFSPDQVGEARDRPEKFRVVDTTDNLLCQWVKQFADAPPPYVRRGTPHIRAEDCDKCSWYEPAGIDLKALSRR